jgi:hypothetical protein
LFSGKYAQVTNNPENDGCINAVLLVWSNKGTQRKKTEKYNKKIEKKGWWKKSLIEILLVGLKKFLILESD